MDIKDYNRAVGETMLSQAEMVATFEDMIRKADQVFEKTTSCAAKMATESGRLDTVVAGQTETSHDFVPGDWIVANPDGERYVMGKAKFMARYDSANPSEPSSLELKSEGFRSYRAIGSIWGYRITEADVQQHFTAGCFQASWGEKMVCCRDDILAVPWPDGGEIYRIEKTAFQDTYRPRP